MRVVIAEDSLLVRTGLVSLLEAAGIRVAGTCGDPDTLLALVAREHPDVAVVDIRMPPTHTDEGLVAAAAIRQQHPDVAVLVLSQYIESTYAQRLLEEDTRSTGYLLKDRLAEPSALTDALERVVRGECIVDPAMVRRLLSRARGRSALDALTDRERQVLALMAEGHSNQGICDILTLSPKTVETHTGHLMAKLGIPDDAAGNRRVLAVLTYLRRR